jgi:thiol-disulfide isomerase/thioredoxin
VTSMRTFTVVGLTAFALGAGFWWLARPAHRNPAQLEAPSITGAALYAAAFRDGDGQLQALGRFQDKLLVVNFWATWCGPCREEMPMFARLQDEWAARGVQFVGVSAEPPVVASRYGSQYKIGYPLWTGQGDVMELSRRLGNHAGVLPHTVLVAPGGTVIAAKVGPYTAEALAQIFAEKAPIKR